MAFCGFQTGTLPPFDAPGAGLRHGLNQGTAAYAIDDLGEIADQFQDPSYVFHGFVRYPNGAFTTFDEPDAGAGKNQGTLAWDINLRGTTAGIYIDANNVYHGFIRSPANKFTAVDPTGSVFTYVARKPVSPWTAQSPASIMIRAAILTASCVKPMEPSHRLTPLRPEG